MMSEKEPIGIMSNSTAHRRGFGIPGVIIIGAVILAIGGLTWYALGNKKAGDTGGILSSLSLNDKCEYTDKDICKFINQFKAQKYYTVSTSTVASSGESNNSTYRISGADKSEVVSSMQDKEIYHGIFIGDTSYMLDYSDNIWVKQTVATNKTQDYSEDFSFSDQASTDDKGQKIEPPKYEAQTKEACGKLTCFKYKVIHATSEAGQEEYIWFDSKDYLIRKSTTKLADGTLTTSEYSYDAFEISEPSPTKDTPAVPGFDMSTLPAF